MAAVKLEGFDAVREKNISGTAFSLLYTVKLDTAFVIGLREYRSAEALRMYERDLRNKFSS